MAISNKLNKGEIQLALGQQVDKVRTLSDGDGLYLRIRPGGKQAPIATWFFASNVGGRRRELGLGSAHTVKVGTARELAAKARLAIVEGRDPFAEKAASKRHAKEKAKVLKFGEFAEDYIKSVEAGFRNEKHVAQWRSTLKTYAAHLAKMRLDEITTDDVLKCLRPIWTAKPETASRVRGRIEKVLSAAKAKGLRPRDSFNPAAYRGHLDILLPRQPKEARGHHAALPFADAPEFMARLRTRPALAARALEFTILTASRTSECLGARWGEIDEKGAVWTVPASRMKAKVEHRVPLSSAALELLKRLRPEEPQPNAPIFGTLSNMAMAMLLRRMKREHITVHGMRSTFRDWAGDATEFPREIVEQALAHQIQSKAEKAYRRQTAVERRRALMEAWANFLDGATAQVVEMPERSRGRKLTPAA